MLGYTRIFYEMQIDIKAHKHEQSLTLHRHFYPPKPRLDEAGQPKPVLIGYAVETQGIRFQINPDLLAQTFEAILADDDLRLWLRRNFAIYQMARYADEWKVFIKSHLEWVGVVVDYWLQEVVPRSYEEPRLLEREKDFKPLRTYYATHRIVRPEEVEEFANYITEAKNFFEALNETMIKAFQETPDFRDFVESVLLHSLSALLKNLIARLGGVGSDDLVAYADMPILKQVDRWIAPRILIMDTVEGGSGGIAQAFERLDLTKNEGSLWWMLQTELGNCPIGNGEALVKAVLTRATVDQILQVQKKSSSEALWELLNSLGLSKPAPESLKILGRILFGEIAGQQINPALIMHDLLALQYALEAPVPGSVSRAVTIRQAVEPARKYIADLRESLSNSGVAEDDLDHELGRQLLAIYNSTCEDGCPVCLSATSDIEHYYLAPLLNSRRVLHKLRQVLAPTQHSDCVDDALPALLEGESRQVETEVAETLQALLSEEPTQVEAKPTTLKNRLEPELGLGIITNIDQTGQVSSASTVATAPDKPAEFLKDNNGWKKRWDKYRTIETPDGTKVRSRAEFIIATNLWHKKIAYQYEVPLAYRNKHGKTAYIHPDFYLYDDKLYVEYWGRDDAEYMESRRFKERVYEQRGIVPLNIEKHEVDNGVFMEKVLTAIGRKFDSTSKTTHTDKVD